MNKLLFALLMAAVAGTAQARGNAEAGKAKAAQVCAACHGPDGNQPSAPDQPILAGQQPAYLINALKAYKSGDRSHPSMRGIAAGLSDQDMADLAAYYGVPAK